MASNKSSDVEAFHGCLVHLFINNIPIKMDDVQPCQEAITTNNLMSFTKGSAFIEIEHNRTSVEHFEVAFTFRTFESKGQIMYQEFENSGYLRLYLEEARGASTNDVIFKGIRTPPCLGG